MGEQLGKVFGFASGRRLFDSLSSFQQYLFLASCLFVSFGAHNLLQEAIMRLPGFREVDNDLAFSSSSSSSSSFSSSSQQQQQLLQQHLGTLLSWPSQHVVPPPPPPSHPAPSSPGPTAKWGIILSWLEVLGVLTCSACERHYVARERTAASSSITSFFWISLWLISSSVLSNLSLNYINYPTKVVFRSCKLIPTMLFGTFINRRVFSLHQYFSALLISVGLILFVLSDVRSAPSFQPLGLVFVFLSVCADAVLPNAQERLFVTGSTRLEVTVYSNLVVFSFITLAVLLNGELAEYLSYVSSDGRAAALSLTYVVVSYVAVSVHMHSIARFGGVATVLLGTARKSMTIMLSYVIFPDKKITFFTCVGAIVVMGGITFSSLWEVKSKSKKGGKLGPTSNGSSGKDLGAKDGNNFTNKQEGWAYGTTVFARGGGTTAADDGDEQKNGRSSGLDTGGERKGRSSTLDEMKKFLELANDSTFALKSN